MNYKIAYVDENDGWLNTFYHTFKNDFEIYKVKVNAESSVDSIFDNLNSAELDAVVTDYLLEEEGEVSFNGNKIIDRIRKHNPYFPVIMLTSHEPEAISHMEDVHIIYGKSILDKESDEALTIFKAKIKSSIENFYSKKNNTTKEIELLVAKKNTEGLTILEEDHLTRLFILSDELEPEGKDMPANLLSRETIGQLNEFVVETRNILEELKKANKK